MYDTGKIIGGLIIFLLLITFPVWYNAIGGKADMMPKPKIVTDAKQCVDDAAFMKTDHMNVLDQWRDLVVRDGLRFINAPDGKRYEMSLSNTCMSCHSNKSEFCDRCHNYLKVDPYCWDCHIEPKE